MYYGQLFNLNWLWWVALVIVIVMVAMFRHHRAQTSFASPHLLRQMVTASAFANGRSVLLATLALLAIVVGLVDIRWGRIWREVPQRGIEVMFVLDVSRSMLAQDTSPNRLERSKQYIKDMIQEMAGDRVGLVLFAGDVKQQIPLTNHYGDYAANLDEIGPHNIDRGGSNLAGAIEVAADSFLEKTSDHRAIVLFTDGEYHENEPVDAAKKALTEHGTRIFTVGIGDSDAGARIPNQRRQRGRTETYLEYEGETVLSKRNDSVLEQIALTTDGAYIPAGTKHVDMAAVYHRFIANIEQQDFDSARVNTYVPRYHWFLGFSLAAILVDILVSTRKRYEHVSSPSAEANETDDVRKKQSSSRAISAAIFVVLALAAGDKSEAQVASGGSEQTPTTHTADSPDALIQLGQLALQQGDMTAALGHFSNAQELGIVDPRLSYNKGIAHYNLGDLAAARDAFAAAAGSADRNIAGDARYNMGNSFYVEALQHIETDPKIATACLNTALEHYRGALACDPEDRDARANIELADRLRRQLQQQQQQQQQQEQEQEQKEQEQKEQEQAQQPSENQDKKESPGQQSGEDDHQEDNRTNEDAQQPDQQSEDKKDAQAPANQQQSQNHPENGDQDQGESEADQSPQDSGEQEPPAEGELQAIKDEQEPLSTLKEGKEGPPMTMQEARKLLQAVRDREFRNRLQQLRNQRPRRIPVEKDW